MKQSKKQPIPSWLAPPFAISADKLTPSHCKPSVFLQSRWCQPLHCQWLEQLYFRRHLFQPSDVCFLSAGLAKIRKVICLQICMAEELHHVQLFRKVVFTGISSSQFSEENSHVYFILYFLSHSFKIRLESFFELRFLHLKTKKRGKSHLP